MAPSYQVETTFKLTTDQSNLVDLAVQVLKDSKQRDYCAYERKGLWHIGLGSLSSITVCPTGKVVTVYSEGRTTTCNISGRPIGDLARDFIQRYSRDGSRVFGYTGFNYAAHCRRQQYKPGAWPLMVLFSPMVELCLGADQCTIKGDDSSQIQALADALRNPIMDSAVPTTIHVDLNQHAQEYITRVTKAISEIASGQYEKIILSRAVSVAQNIDIPGTLKVGRPCNNPARSFVISHDGRQAAGFSPELVMLLENGKVTTQPLAGTRARVGDVDEIERLRSELIADPKEVVEHTISVREAVKELEKVCDHESITIPKFMEIKARGPVQHLGSTVTGMLADGKDAWNAFDVLFPSITASGIPKSNALEAIQRLEDQPRELYSGAVLLCDGEDFLEATLVLRTVFQDKSRAWLQAGAGVLLQSESERELVETREKLGSVAPFVVADSDVMAQSQEQMSAKVANVQPFVFSERAVVA